jgi:hypothetical protein
MEMNQNPERQLMNAAVAQSMIENTPKQRSAGRRYPLKDTISIPSKGFTRFRIKADNPGFWFLHCHYEWHMSTGMAAIVQVGETSDMIPPPANFPKCGNFLPTINDQFFTSQWVRINATKEIPLNCHIGGNDLGSHIYIARRSISENEIILGKYSTRTKLISGT